MHPLLEQLQPFLAREDVEGLTQLLEAWTPRDDVWLECVEGRLYAPSSTDEQRQRLRAVRATHRAHGATGPAPAVEPSPSPASARPAERVVGPPAPPALEAALVEAEARVGDLAGRSAATASALLAIVRREQQHEHALRRAQYDEALAARRLPAGTSFEAFLASLTRRSVRVGPAAGPSDLAAVQALAPVPLDASLLDFYSTLGGLVGELGAAGLALHVPAPRAILASHGHPQRAQRLAGLSLHDFARWCWGSDRPELEPGALPAEVERLARATPCIGWISDGFSEAHGYLVQRADGLFQVHLWHQDDAFSAPESSSASAGELWTLLVEMMTRLEHAAPLEVESLSELLAVLGPRRGSRTSA